MRCDDGVGVWRFISWDLSAYRCGKYIFTRFEREVVCFRLVVRVNKLIKLIINIERHDVEELP